MSNYIPHDELTVKEMLTKIGVESLDDLYKDIPKELLIPSLNLPEGLSEPDLLEHLTNLANKNTQYDASFLGAGSYYHYIPTIVDFISSRSEFYTSYTPYQAEMSQGFLQAIFEYQSAIARLTEMDVVNASMYDGASALAEACILACNSTNKSKILIYSGLHPNYHKVIETYCWGRDFSMKEFLPTSALQDQLNDEYAAVVIQNPNFLGEILDLEQLISEIRVINKKCLIIQVITDPTCLGILKTPGELGIDIFVAEGQSFGNPPLFGGPGLGILATNKKLMRKIPGRLIGLTKELDGDKEGFVLTLQAREQHIRREKALSNICSNQALVMLRSLIYLVSMGKTGLKSVAEQNFQKADYVRQKLRSIGYNILSTGPVYNEFAFTCKNADKFCEILKENHLLPPLRLDQFYEDHQDQLLICVTEMNRKNDIELFLLLAKDFIEGGN